jgi:hypothetical protein
MFINLGTAFFCQTGHFGSSGANTYEYVRLRRSFLTSTLMLTTENVSETLAFNCILKQLIAPENFDAFRYSLLLLYWNKLLCYA